MKKQSPGIAFRYIHNSFKAPIFLQRHGDFQFLAATDDCQRDRIAGAVFLDLADEVHTYQFHESHIELFAFFVDMSLVGFFVKIYPFFGDAHVRASVAFPKPFSSL